MRLSALVRQLNRILRHLRREIHAKSDPLGYAKSIGVRLGSDVHFYGMPSGMFGSEPYLITIGDHCHITSGVQFVTHDGGTLIFRHQYPDLDWTAPIVVGSFVYIGMRTIVLPGVTIGDHCVIGAGSVVSRSIPSNSVAGGVPARVIRATDEYLERLKAKSLGCGHLHGAEKVRFYREHFGIRHQFRSTFHD